MLKTKEKATESKSQRTLRSVGKRNRLEFPVLIVLRCIQKGTNNGHFANTFHRNTLLC